MNYLFIKGLPPTSNTLHGSQLEREEYPLGSFLLYGLDGEWYHREKLNEGIAWLRIEADEVPAEYRAWVLLL